MKKVFSLMVATGLLVFATSAFATVANTKHNLTMGANATATTDGSATLCGFCHIPHGGQTIGGGSVPLWAKPLPVGPYSPYGSGLTLAGTVVSNMPGTFSLTCLSCHDGTIGIGVYSKNNVMGNRTITTTNAGWTLSSITTVGPLNSATGQAFNATDLDLTNGYSPYIGTDLTNDHPVGFQWNEAQYGVGSTPGIGAGHVTALGNPGSFITGFTSGNNYPLFNETTTDRFECATCHDPHLEPANLGTPTEQSKFLRAQNSQVCQDCHDLK